MSIAGSRKRGALQIALEAVDMRYAINGEIVFFLSASLFFFKLVKKYEISDNQDVDTM